MADRWTYHKLDRSLEIVDAPELVSTAPEPGKIPEEAFESILAVHLGKLFPGFDMMPIRFSLSPLLSGADIIGADSAGTLHVFELKYGAPTRDVLEQVLAYVVRMLVLTSAEEWGRVSALDTASYSTEILSQRVVGVLLGKRLTTDKTPLKDLCTRGGISLDHVERVAARIAEGLQSAETRWPGWRLNDVHVHIVVPKFGREKAGLVDSAALLRKRYTRLSLWESRVELPDQHNLGGVWVKPVPVDPDPPMHRSDTRLPDAYESFRVLARLLAAIPDLSSRRWVYRTEAIFNGGRGAFTDLQTRSGRSFVCAVCVKEVDTASLYVMPGREPANMEAVAEGFAEVRTRMKGIPGVAVRVPSKKLLNPYVDVSRLDGESRDKLNDRAGNTFADAMRILRDLKG